ncbi:hypothetical protein KY289_036862 [Solanum tuberosum]|nr:hypothetical protein KY289_036862 [Solanum tuberosum]
MQRSPWILLCQFSVYLDDTRQRAIILSKVIHLSTNGEVQRLCISTSYLLSRETKQNYMPTLKPYTNEVKDTIIDALKANLEGVTVLTSAVENKEDEILGENNSNQPCENSVSSGQKNKDDNLCERVASLELSMMKFFAFILDEKLRRAQKTRKMKVD